MRLIAGRGAGSMVRLVVGLAARRAGSLAISIDALPGAVHITHVRETLPRQRV